MRNADKRNRAVVGLNQDHGAIEHGPGIAHPRAQHGTVSRCLMMGMVPGMLDRLSLGQPAHGQDAENEED
jgi:hypothetical protein